MQTATWRMTILACLLLAGCGDTMVHDPYVEINGLKTPATEQGVAPGADEASSAPAVNAATPAASEEKVTLRILDWAGVQELVAQHQGKVVVMDVWMTACDPCLKEFPGLVALHKKYSRDDLICVSLSLDYEGRKGRGPEVYQEPVLNVLRGFGATFDNVLMSEDPDSILGKLKLGAPPAVYVYSRDGQLAKRFDNEMAQSEEDSFTYADVGKLVEELVSKLSTTAPSN